MKYIEPYSIFKVLNESLLGDDQRIVNKAFLNMADPNTGECMWDGQVIKPSTVLNVVEDALMAIRDDWPYWYSHLLDYHIIWANDAMGVGTMAVDKNLNLYINPVFVQYYLKGTGEFVQFVLMHEMMHVVFRHVARSINFLENTPLDRTWDDTNLAGDLEINTFLVSLAAITKEQIKNEIGGGVILDDVDEVINMETILENDALVKVLRDKWSKPMDKSMDPDDGGDQQGNNQQSGQQGDDQQSGQQGGGQQSHSASWQAGYDDAVKTINDMVDKGMSTEEIKEALRKMKK